MANCVHGFLLNLPTGSKSIFNEDSDEWKILPDLEEFPLFIGTVSCNIGEDPARMSDDVMLKR